jgi:nitronate monooxygenase
VDGRGVAAALALGAEAVVMGTRFVAAEEAWTPEFRKKLILEATDGGPSTVKTPVLDDIQSTAIWPDVYDGRGLIGKSWQDHVAGMPLEENIQLFKEADAAGDTSRKITWVGTGVGLVREIRPAGEIVKEAREDALRRIQRLQAAI